MTAEEIYGLIELNKVAELRILTGDGSLLSELYSTNPAHCVEELRNLLPSLTSYKRIIIQGRPKSKDKEGNDLEKGRLSWANAYKWSLDTPGSQIQGAAIANIPQHGQSIGAMEYITMFTGMMEKNQTLQNQLFQEQMLAKQSSPEKWMPVIAAILPVLGFGGAPAAAMAGKPMELVHGDVQTPKAAADAIEKHLDSLTHKITAPQMAAALAAFDANPKIGEQIDTINKLLVAIIEKPQLLQAALAFI